MNNSKKKGLKNGLSQAPWRQQQRVVRLSEGEDRQTGAMGQNVPQEIETEKYPSLVKDKLTYSRKLWNLKKEKTYENLTHFFS